jgi:hypothetical protein
MGLWGAHLLLRDWSNLTYMGRIVRIETKKTKKMKDSAYPFILAPVNVEKLPGPWLEKE